MTSFKILRTSSRRGRRLLEQLCQRGDTLLDRKILERTGKIVESVRQGGDRALLKATRRFDGSTARAIDELRLTSPGDAEDHLPAGIEEALERAIVAVERFHERQVHPSYWTSENGLELVERRTPYDRVGIYVPGGRAAYPSTVVMTAVPARLAGVSEIVVVTPPRSWQSSSALRYVLERLEIREVLGVGGAQAVAALAYGTESVQRVDKIVGPGNAWVTAAKHLVSGDVAIDGLAGPSEVVIVADGDADAELVAADLLAQAEHDPRALAVLVTDRAKLAKRVASELTRQLEGLPTAEVARDATCAALIVAGMDEALSVVNALAPEHLQLIGTAAEALADEVSTAAAIFVGPASPVVFGDYLAGPSHVLPTAGTARFASALGVEDFIRRSHVVRFDATAARRAATAAAVLAEAEGLPAHAASARLRLNAG